MENIDGYLMKYTNLVTGWQYRYVLFCVSTPFSVVPH